MRVMQQSRFLRRASHLPPPKTINLKENLNEAIGLPLVLKLTLSYMLQRLGCRL